MTFAQEPPERIIPIDLRDEMSQSYLEYAMSVIVGRALPDARDGLKPVHRRILYAMHELGLAPDRPFRKCARVVGDVIGKYHPHGDSAVYEALVRMAQDFSMRLPLIDGHGNFGSIDNDPPAAMRYTECRLRAITTEGLLHDIESETVDFSPNYDGSQQEPTVMPARVPQLLLNGSSGIAVGMATNIPPHNLGELVDGLTALIQNPEITDGELMRIIPGPDFPTGAKVLGTSGIREAYTSGRGSITMRAVATFETIEQKGRPDREAIIVTELPYQTNKAALIEKIAELVNDKKLEGIVDIRDESDRDGMRIVIELKRDAYPQVVLNNLYKQTPMQTNFGANMLALVGGEPQLLSLKQFLKVFLDFREECILRRTRYHQRKAQERDHLLQGLLIALANLDAVISLIRHAADAVIAKQELMDGYSLSEQQSDAILQMQLRRLTALESEKIQKEHEDLQAQIADLQDILDRRERVLSIIQDEAGYLKTKFASPRRTAIEASGGGLEDIDLIANEKSIVLVTEQGYIKRMPVSTFEAQNRATRGRAGARVKEDDAVEHFFACNDHDSVLFFSDRGVVFSLKAFQIPLGSRTSRGAAVVQLLPISREEKVTSVVPVSAFTEDEYLVMMTSKGFIKKTVLSAFASIRTNGLIAISLEDGDELRWVRLTRAEDSIIIGSRLGMAIHFRADNNQLRPLGRATRGVKSMNLRKGDELIGMDILPSAVVSRVEETADEAEELEPTESSEEIVEEVEVGEGPWVLVITTNGFGKRVPVTQFRLQNRAGKGLTATKFKTKKGKGADQVAALRVVNAAEELMIVTHRGIVIRQAIDAISSQSRAATGVRVQRLDEDDAIAGIAVVPASEEEEVLEEGAEAEALVAAEAALVEAVEADTEGPDDIDDTEEE
jgi:DNA gyrase subunit A